MIRNKTQIGRWVFDPSLNSLASGADALSIEPKMADLLCVLADRAGRTVSREELLEAVWPGVVVGDDALSQSINKLRRALGDSSREASYIQTVPKRGYRLIAPVCEPVAARSAPTPVVGTAAATPAAAPDSPPIRAPRRRWVSWTALASAGAALALAALLYVPFYQSSADRDLAVLVAMQAPDAAPTETSEVLMRRFDAIGDDPDSERVARALWQHFAAGVSQSHQLRVVLDDRDAPASAPVPPTQRYQVDGTVQRLSGGRLAVQLVLLRPATGTVLWSRRAELKLQDLLDGGDRTTADLLDALTVTLTRSERERLARPFTLSPLAFQHYLDGQAAFAARDPIGNATARRHFEQAIAADPAFARAYAGIALTHAADATFGWVSDRKDAATRAVEHARRAELLDGQLPEVHWVLGWIAAQRREHAQALHDARRAIELNASYADAYALAGSVATYIGRPDDAIILMREAVRLRRAPGFLYHLVNGRAYFQKRDDVRAIAHLRASLDRNPAHLESRIYLAAALQRSGTGDESAWEAQEIRAQQPAFDLSAWLADGLMTDPPTLAAVATALAPLGLSDLSPQQAN